jgi:putative oxidoreductase
MSTVRSSQGRSEDRVAAFDANFVFLRRFADPVVLVARAMMAYIFIAEGIGTITGSADVAGYMREHGVAPTLLPLVILTELGGGLLILLGLKTRWAAIALAGFCLLTAIMIHLPANETIEVQKNLAMAGGFLVLAVLGSGAWSIDGWPGRAEYGSGVR